jgi:hypothetical protein
MYPSSQTETKTTQPRPGRPNTAPAYYLARPASIWVIATTRHAAAPDAAAKLSAPRSPGSTRRTAAQAGLPPW